MKINKSIIITVFLVVLFNSIVYSSLNTEMFINGDAYIRVDKDIRITDLKVLEQINGSYETYNSDYSKNSTSMQVSLPSSESFVVYEVTITNKGDINYEVTNIIEESYSNSNIKYELIDIEKGKIIGGKTTHNFKIKFTTTENNPDNTTTLVLKYDFKEWIPSLYKMVAYKSRDLDTDIDFGVAPTKESSGVYEMNSTKDDEYPVYYYRGIIDNNNVSFAGFCWKIVRTTSTGGVKLIYNGVPGSDGSCNNIGVYSLIGTSRFNSSARSKEDVSYVYDNGVDSEIKKVIDKWYSANMIKYTSMLEDTIWCNNRSISNTIDGTIYYELFCSNDNDKFTVSSSNGNGKLTYPVALLTFDEFLLAGYGAKGLYLDIEYSWWLLSPAYFNKDNYAFVYNVFSGSVLGTNHVVNIYGVRPVISLFGGIMIKEGDGSIFSPYKLIEE